MNKSSRPRKAAIFDLGGVLLELTPPRQDAAFRALGARRAFSELGADPAAKRILDAFEVGALSPEEFRREVSEALELPPVPTRAFDEAFAQILGGFLDENLALLAALRSERSVHLLSNTNALHTRLFEELFAERYGRSFRTAFDGVYYSQDIGVRKPEPEAFLRIVRENDLEPRETLFVDDLAENREAAAAVGLIPVATTTNARLGPLPK